MTDTWASLRAGDVVYNSDNPGTVLVVLARGKGLSDGVGHTTYDLICERFRQTRDDDEPLSKLGYVVLRGESPHPEAFALVVE